MDEEGSGGSWSNGPSSAELFEKLNPEAWRWTSEERKEHELSWYRGLAEQYEVNLKIADRELASCKVSVSHLKKKHAEMYWWSVFCSLIAIALLSTVAIVLIGVASVSLHTVEVQSHEYRD